MTTDFTRPLPCIVCGTAMENAFENEDVEPLPYRGTSFTSGGHYGSTVFDPVVSSQEYLRVNVCDVCMRKAAEAGRIWLCHPQYLVAPTELQLWRVGEES